MDILVQKYGGSSLATLDQVRAVAARVAGGHRTRRPVVVVVSARGRTTDGLLDLTRTLSGRPPARETDQLLATAESSSAAQLAMALDALGVPAASLTGGQAGVQVRGPHGEGRITAIRPERVHALLRQGFVPVVSGFQGVNAGGDVTTLGRGGSDTTAVALAAALKSPRCEIYTDVAGVFSADPRIIRRPRKLPELDCRVMAEMARSGARVMHSRSVDLAFARNVEVHIRHAAHPDPGSVLVKKGITAVEEPCRIVAITHDPDTAVVSLTVDPADHSALPEALDHLAAAGIDVDLLSRTSGTESARADFTVPRGRLGEARTTLDSLGMAAHIDESLGKVSLVGSGPAADAAHAARALRALGRAGITSSSLHTAQLRTSMLVPLDRLSESVAVLHTAFGLDDPDTCPPVPAGTTTVAPR
ncbi:aspartate kinase [Streptomyces sp. XM4011]|uniref:aspartate kinase n=1 Tax=Streptomyces sp. XM4011 TaxID=2929780 RepID=UPI001FFA4A02|nr:aspartate kinase [Streptomyces sp. XM4011]MCK1815693.1 aspartate kinase [Streptomyces sp. XM4011]